MGSVAKDVKSAMTGATEPADLAGQWIEEINGAEKASAEWFKRGKRIIDLYKDRRTNKTIDRRRLNILWSNVETIGPAIYARTPQAVVSRRFKDADPVGRVASEVLERALNYALEEYDFDSKMILSRKDYLLVGRGQSWIRYEPIIETAEGQPKPVNDDDKAEAPEPLERVTYERVLCDHVAWDDFLTNAAREWSEVRWVARRVFMTREELTKRFPKTGATVVLDSSTSTTGDNPERNKKAQVYEIWDKTTKRAIWISKSQTTEPLDVRADPLGLEGFFPCPEALYATLGPDSIIPVPDYALYQDQAEELDDLTGRIGKLTDALRLVGFYAGDEKAVLQRVFDPGKENTLIPIESWAAFAERGGVKGLIEWVPIEMVIQALNGCYEARQHVIEDIYQITGISDIVRGESDPAETATAARLKGQWGSLRVRDRQTAMARYARDIIRLKGEIIAEKFGIDTLKKMTGVELLTEAERNQFLQIWPQTPRVDQGLFPRLMGMIKTAISAMTGQAQPAPPMPPEIKAAMDRPTWEDVHALLSDNAMRQFRIEIETDSTIEPDDAEQKAAAVEFVTTIATLLANAAPVVQLAPPLGKLVGEAVKFLTRKYRIGREMEETIDQVMDEIAQMPAPQPEAQAPQGDPNAAKVATINLQAEQVKQQGSVQAQSIKAQGQLQGKQLDAQMQQNEMPLKTGELQLKAAVAQRDPNPQVNA